MTLFYLFRRRSRNSPHQFFFFFTSAIKHKFAAKANSSNPKLHPIMALSEFDKEFLRELRADFQRDLYETLDREHAKGLNTNPHYGMTQWEIDQERASLECDPKVPKQEEYD